MEYQPFLDMHLLISDELIEAIYILSKASLQLVLGIAALIFSWVWLRRY